MTVARKFAYIVAVACFACTLHAATLKPANQAQTELDSARSMRAAYDDGLEILEEDEENGARAQGLDDTLVRAVVDGMDEKRMRTKRIEKIGSTLSPVARTADFLGSASLEVLKVLAAQLEADINTLKTLRARERTIPHPSRLVNQPNPMSKVSTTTNKQQHAPRPVKNDILASEPLGSKTGHIMIGNEAVLSSRVTAIGDLDGNGIDDYVVSSPKEDNGGGAARVYLMGAGSVVNIKRHLVPGKSGFMPRAFAPGDMFGTSVLSVGDLNGDGVPDVAVGAPGDSESGKSTGAVYIFLMKRDGSVLFTQKVSADKDESLNRQHAKIEGFGTTIRLSPYVNGDKWQKLAVGSKDGFKTIVILTNKRHAHASVKILRAEPFSKPDKNDSNLRLIRTDRLDLLRLSAKAAAGECFFSETHCQCEASQAQTAKCLDVKKTLSDGRIVCTKRDCKQSYRCSCDGSQFCSHGSEAKTVYREGTALESGKSVFCLSEDIQTERVTLLPGVAIPNMAPLGQGSSAGTWNATHCSCSQLSGKPAGTCMQFDHKAQNEAFCLARACKNTEMTCELNGVSMCTRQEVNKIAWVDDGKFGGTYHRCHEGTIQNELVECTSECPK
jgi:FG-GAP repeat